MITDLDLSGALSNLLSDYADHDRMSLHQEAYAEQSREYLTLAIDRLKAIDALRPPCPTCGGMMRVDTGRFQHSAVMPVGERIYIPCPDCVDGKVSIEQLAATWQTVEKLRARLTQSDWIVCAEASRILDEPEALREVKP